MCCSLYKNLVVFCVFYMLTGIALTATSVWVIATTEYLSQIIGIELFITASAVVIFGGVLFIISGAIGLFATSKHDVRLMKVFIIFLLVVFLILVAGGGVAVMYTGDWTHGRTMGDAMEKSLVDNYGHKDKTDITEAWDKLQNDFRCCGVRDSGWALYKNTSFFAAQKADVKLSVADVKYVPVSCCVYDADTGKYIDLGRCQSSLIGPPANPTTQFKNRHLFYDGCFTSMQDFLLNNSWVLAGMGFILAVAMLTGVIFAILYVRDAPQKR